MRPGTKVHYQGEAGVLVEFAAMGNKMKGKLNRENKTQETNRDYSFVPFDIERRDSGLMTTRGSRRFEGRYFDIEAMKRS